MDASELLSLKLSLHDALAPPGAAPAADALLSAFAAATSAPSACAPFPKALFAGDRRCSDARRLVDESVPPLRDLLRGPLALRGGGGAACGGAQCWGCGGRGCGECEAPPGGKGLEAEHDEAGGGSSCCGDPPDAAWRLLQWLLLHLAPQRGALRASSAAAVLRELGAAGPGPRGPRLARLGEQLSSCCCILEASRPPPRGTAAGGAMAAGGGGGEEERGAAGAGVRRRRRRPRAGDGGEEGGSCGEEGGGGGADDYDDDGGVFCFHGTPFARLHSILHNGLLNATGTRAAANGALFGAGIYASTDLGTALAFTAPARGWARSALGRRLRCALACRATGAAAAHGRRAPGAGGSDNGGGEKQGPDLPDTYLVIENPADIEIRYVLLWSDDAVVEGRASPVTPDQIASLAGCGSSGARAWAVPGEPAAAGGGSGARGARARGPDACWLLAVVYVGLMLLFAALRLRAPVGP